jgi:hypothetical protein
MEAAVPEGGGMKVKQRPQQPKHIVVQADGRILTYLSMTEGANREQRRSGDKAIKTYGRSLAYKRQHPKQYKHATKNHSRAVRHEKRIRSYIERLMKAAESVVRSAA